jgi:hypothetical protein
MVTREAYHNGRTTVWPASPARQKPRVSAMPVGRGVGEIRGSFAPKTQHVYLQRAKNFTAYLGRSPDTASSEDVQRCQLHLTASSVGVPTTVNQTVSPGGSGAPVQCQGSSTRRR